MNPQLGILDQIVIGLYLTGIVGLGCWVGLRHRRHKDGGKDYFLAGGTLTWPIIGLALFSTNISTIHLVGFAQEGYVNGLAYGNFEWMAPFTLIITALFFAPFYIRSRVATLPDFLEKRYNRPCRDWLAVLSIIAAIFMHIGFSLYMGAVLLKAMFGVELMTSVIVITLLTGIYTIVGGLIAVVVTESIQTIILLAGSIVITAIAYSAVGGFEGIHETLEANNELVKMTVLRSAEEQPELPWYAVLLGYPVIGIWYWCTDQTIVQRVLGAKDENHARVGPLFCGFIKILPVFLFVLPGLMVYVLVQNDPAKFAAMDNLPIGDTVELDDEMIALTEARVLLEGQKLKVGGNTFEIQGKQVVIEQRPLPGVKEDRVLVIDGVDEKDTKAVYGFMIRELLPPGLKGVVAAALLAALMSTVSGALNSIATLFSFDIVKRWRPQTSDQKLVLIGRITTFAAMVLAIIWTPAIARFGSMYQGIIALICYIAPPITAVFLLGVLWRRASSISAQLTLYIGSALGFTVFVLDWFKDDTGWNVPSMMAGFYLFVICVVVQVVIALIQPHAHTKESEELVWNNPLDCVRSPGWPGVGNYKFLAALLFVVMVLLYWLFA